MPGSADYITLVSGLPRSGTSVMMQMLATGGVSILTDNQRIADVHNPRGYYELEAVKHTRTDQSWVEQARGKAVKVVHLLIPSLPLNFNYRVIFMQRDLPEVIASQRAMLQKEGRAGAALPDAKLEALFQKQLADVRQWLAQHPNFTVMEVQHRDVILQPLAVAQQVAAFLGQNLEPEKMAGVVDSALYRQRR